MDEGLQYDSLVLLKDLAQLNLRRHCNEQQQFVEQWLLFCLNWLTILGIASSGTVIKIKSAVGNSQRLAIAKPVPSCSTANSCLMKIVITNSC